MSKLSRQHMKKAIQHHEARAAGRQADMYITIGMYMAEVVLANDFGWGKQRLGRLEAGVHALCRVEMIQGAEKDTENYTNNVEHGFGNIAKRLEQIYGDGHCGWMKELRLKK